MISLQCLSLKSNHCVSITADEQSQNHQIIKNSHTNIYIYECKRKIDLIPRNSKNDWSINKNFGLFKDHINRAEGSYRGNQNPQGLCSQQEGLQAFLLASFGDIQLR